MVCLAMTAETVPPSVAEPAEPDTTAESTETPRPDMAAPDAVAPAGPLRRLSALAGARADAFAIVAYGLFTFWVTYRLWFGWGRTVSGANPDDQLFHEYALWQHARALTEFGNPLFTRLLNAPDGVNLMANPVVQLPAALLVPVTLLAGAHISFLFLQSLNLLATAVAWYFVLSRRLVRSRLAAFLGGGFCAFSPAMISQTAGGHMQITGQYLVPLIVWQVFAVRERGHTVRRGLVLGLLVAAQIFIGEEVLFLAAVACGLVVVAYVVWQPRLAWQQAPAFLGAVAIAVPVALAIAAYPLWMQFLGPQHYLGLGVEYRADLASYFAYARESLGGDAAVAGRLAINATEENEFFGGRSSSSAWCWCTGCATGWRPGSWRWSAS
jgi:hypothetical protein